MSKGPRSTDPRLSKVAAASLTDAMGRRYPHPFHIEGLISPNPDRRLFGRAVTIRFVPFRADLADPKKHNFARLFYEAIGDEGSGKVLVLSSSGRSRISVGGGTKLSWLENHHLAGLISDGRLRDFAELHRYGFAAWCAGETVRAGGEALMPFEANVPVNLRGATVVPGDFVYADRSGAVIIPEESIDSILDEAIRIEAEDRRYLEVILGEDRDEIMKRGSAET